MTVKIRPDLIIPDISMPAGTGFHVAERIQALIPTATPLIFLTESKRPEFRKRALELGVVGFFQKLYEAGELLEAIESVRHRPTPS